MNDKSKFAFTLASLTFLFMVGILSIFTVYLVQGHSVTTLHKTQIMNKFSKTNKSKLENIKSKEKMPK